MTRIYREINRYFFQIPESEFLTDINFEGIVNTTNYLRTSRLLHSCSIVSRILRIPIFWRC